MKYSPVVYQALGVGKENFDSIPSLCHDTHLEYRLCKFQKSRMKCKSKWNEIKKCLKDYDIIKNNNFVCKAYTMDTKKAMELGISPSFEEYNNLK